MSDEGQHTDALDDTPHPPTPPAMAVDHCLALVVSSLPCCSPHGR